MKNRAFTLAIAAILVSVTSPAAFGAQTEKMDSYLAKGALLTKWPKERMPISVYISPGNSVPGFKDSFKQDAKISFAQWEAASQGKIHFAFADDPNTAMIRLNWTNDRTKLTPRQDEIPAGEARCIVTEVGIDSCVITVLTVAPMPGEKFNDNMLHWVLLHEIGHALGLTHSTEAGDIMFINFSDAALIRPPMLSTRDKTTLEKLYSDAVKLDFSQKGIFDEAAKLKGVSVTHDVENDTAVDAVDAHNFDKAIAIYEKLMVERPNMKLYRDNYIGTLNKAGNEAIDNQQYDTGCGYLEKAYRFEPGDVATEANLGRANLYRADHIAQNGQYAESEPYYKRALEVLPKQRADWIAQAANNYAYALMQLSRRDDARRVAATYWTEIHQTYPTPE